MMCPILNETVRPLLSTLGAGVIAVVLLTLHRGSSSNTLLRSDWRLDRSHVRYPLADTRNLLNLSWT
jgi:hypothetical protein